MFENYSHKIQKNNDILLIHSPVWHIIEPNLGLCYITQYLLDNNIKVSYFDINDMLLKIVSSEKTDFYWNPSQTELWANNHLFSKNTLKDFDKILYELSEYIVHFNIPVLGFSLNRTNLPFVTELINRIKKLNSKIFFIGGGFLCGLPEIAKQFLDLFDIVVVGEGEITVLKIIKQYLEKNINFNNIPGVLTKDNYSNFTFALQTDINILPYPKFNFLDIKNYRPENSSSSAVHLNMARGCYWGKCTFCQSAKISSGYRARKLNSVLDEIGYLRNKKNVKNFYFSDLAFGKNIKECKEFLKKIIKLYPDIKLSGQMRFDNNYDNDFFMLMKRGGFHGISFGLESGSQKIVNKLKKGFNMKTAIKCLKACHLAGIEAVVFIIVGHPDETEPDFYETYQFLIDYKQYISRIEQICLFEFQYGTPAYENIEFYIKEKGLEYPDCAGENGNIFLWEIPDKNTMDLRIKRQQILYMLADKIGLGKGHYSQQEDTTNLLNQSILTMIVRKTEKSKFNILLKIYRFLKYKILKKS